MNRFNTCADCGATFGPPKARPLCGFCESEDDALREHVARSVRFERMADDPEKLRAERDRLRPISTTAAVEQVRVPRFANRWVRVGNHFSLRAFPVAQPVQVDRWGKKV